MKSERISTTILMVFFVLVPSSAPACTTPVFRYALERWAADCYDAVLFHRGPLTQQEQKLLDKLQQKDVEEAVLNLNVVRTDITSSTEQEVKGLLMNEMLPDTLPALVLWHPKHKGHTPAFLQVRLTASTVEAFFNSPVRQQLAERLTEGQTAVWLFIESGDIAGDKAAIELLEKELETATRELKEKAESIPAELAGPKIEYEFSVLPVSRSDPNETVLLSLLLGSEPDLGDYSRQPVVFPVFGRGRALYALIGKGINTENIQETISFIAGPCGCELKVMNPGVDLLMAVNWDAAAMKFYDEFSQTYNEIPELTGVMPEVPEATAEIQTGDTATINNISDPDRRGPDDIRNAAETTQAIEVKQQKTLGLGLIGTTGIMLTVIVLIVILATIVLNPHRKGQL
ncbi:MAG: hypothetical protein JW837_02110 [Sedimentisphaerales bacterium]|nr:hypothetical protein [Sedimentisphaerales bacterium]